VWLGSDSRERGGRLAESRTTRTPLARQGSDGVTAGRQGRLVGDEYGNPVLDGVTNVTPVANQLIAFANECGLATRVDWTAECVEWVHAN